MLEKTLSDSLDSAHVTADNTAGSGAVPITLCVNGTAYALAVLPSTTLAEALRRFSARLSQTPAAAPLPGSEAKKPIGPSEADMPKLFVPKLSEIELLVAIDVIRSAIAEHRKHLDLEALRSALAKLTAAYGGENRGRAR